MLINFKDPESIAAWFEVFPARHGPQLAVIKRLHPQFEQAIDRAGQLVRARRLAAKVASAGNSIRMGQALLSPLEVTN